MFLAREVNVSEPNTTPPTTNADNRTADDSTPCDGSRLSLCGGRGYLDDENEPRERYCTCPAGDRVRAADATR